MGKHYGHIIIEKVLELKESGKTLKEIGMDLGYTREQIKWLLENHRKKERKEALGIAVNKKGRPPKESKLSETDKVSELRYKLSRKDYRIKQLEMEVELLRDFLKETGRK